LNGVLRSRVLPEALTGLVAVLSALGLLCTRVDFYDDSALLMGGRLVRAGWLPYVDFYTHYGPFAYTVQGLFLAAVGNPGLALRIGQASLLLLLALLAIVSVRKVGEGAAAAWGVLFLLVALSSTSRLAAFYGFGLAVASLLAFSIRDGSGSGLARGTWAALGGVFLACTALTRPAFALYAGAALLLVYVAADQPRGRSVWVGFGAGAATVVLLWIVLYRQIPIGKAVEMTLLFPGRLMAGGGRYVEAPFLRAPPPVAFLAGAMLVSTTFVWALALGSRRARTIAAAGVAAGGAAALWLRASEHPGRDSALVAGLLLALGTAAAFSERARLRDSAQLRSAALLGLAAAAFSHYFWARSDEPHLLLFLTLAAGSAAFITDRLRARGRLALLVLFLVSFPVWIRRPSEPLIPIEALWIDGARTVLQKAALPGASLRSVWPAGEVEAIALNAVAVADRGADRGSRFVAVGSSHAESDINPVIVFLLSSRLPYTKWYAYDPGLQSSPQIQQEMIRELERSGSRTAVVWEVHPRAARPTRTAFDEAFNRLYPVRVARFGTYEVRSR
jgi:hypothetical protein